MSDPWKHPLPAWLIVKAVAPGLQVPKGGWHAAAFARHGRALIKGFVRMSRIVTKKARPVIAERANAIFRRQLNEVVARVLARAGQRSAKAEAVQISIVSQEALWARAMDEVFAEAGIQAVIEIVPPIQSVMAQAYSRSSLLLGLERSGDASVQIANASQRVASRIVGINDTTRNVFNREILQSIKDGDTVTETAARLREVLPEINRNRVATISRTETQSAWTQGSVKAMQEAHSLTHVSVIGCESREQNRWNQPSYQQFMYRGESTCNIQDVPVQDADKLNFHPNHTGTIVPSAFRSEDGSSEAIG